MPVMHLTQKFRKQLGSAFLAANFLPEENLSDTNTVLTAWSGNMFIFQSRIYVMFTNEDTLLTILLPLVPKKTLLARFIDGLSAELLAMGVPRGSLIAEVKGHRTLYLLQGSNRQILGYMNDMLWTLEAHLQNVLFQKGATDLWSGQRFLNDEFLHLGRFQGVTRDYVKGRFRIR
ncbi:MAG: DUF6933 domain-containing protein [Chitinispirillaceae bacterium]